MKKFNEKEFEDFIEEHLLTKNGYRQRKQVNFDRTLCLDKDLLEEFLNSTQSEGLEKLKEDGIDYIKEISNKFKTKGVLELLQKGVEIKNTKLKLAFDKPNSNKNPDLTKNYEKNIFSIIRQVHFSTHNQESLDIVLFLNGLAILTMELKNAFTGQKVENAKIQYKKRNPNEELLKGVLVHFALDSDEVYMSSKLKRQETEFLPFNRGLNDGSGEIGKESGAGNPPSKGVKTAYLWESIFEKDTLLFLIFHFITKLKSGVIFPRYHQFDVVRKLLADAKENGVGKRYLIQHSAGSGKSNSIAWLAHNLVSLHKDDEALFNSVIIVTDRIILDRQLQDIVEAFSKTPHLVEAIKEGSRQLKEALEDNKKIIITTIQKFPYIVDELKGELKNKNFAVIIDEAHSSQSGSTAQSLSATLGLNDEETEDLEEQILKIMQNKKFQENASYFAFTATPKPKTLEMFGVSYKHNNEKKFIAFHLYSMKQAIEEGFILDVLKNYITYKSFYKITTSLKGDTRLEFEKDKAFKKIDAYVKAHPKTIEKKAEIMIEHFFTNIARKIGNRAKAMIVTSSRKNAVQYYFEFKKILRERYPKFRALVAFSGELKFDEKIYREDGLNGFSETMLKDKFKEGENRFLIVADKYQTGFDEPLLHTMYVDKKLSGVNAVQTLSRLNRICKDKNDTFVLDFENIHEEIGKAFSVFYKQTYLEKETDIDKIIELKNELFASQIFTQDELEAFITAILNGEKEDAIHSKLDRMITRYDQKEDEQRSKFYNNAKTYLRTYNFLALIYPYKNANAELEKLSILLKKLIAKISPPNLEDLAKGIIDNISLEAIRVEFAEKKEIKLSENGGLKASNINNANKKEHAMEELLGIIKEFNIKNWEELEEPLNDIKENIKNDEQFRRSYKAPSSDDNLKNDVGKKIEKEMGNIINNNDKESYIKFYNQFSNNEEFEKKIIQKMFDIIIKEIKEMDLVS